MDSGIAETRYSALRESAAAFARLEKNSSGFPRLRPQGIKSLTDQIRAAVDDVEDLIRAGDRETKNELSTIIESVLASDVVFYPRESLGIRILLARINLISNDIAGVRKSLGLWLDRPYAAEAGVHELGDLYALDGTLQLLEGAASGEIGATAARRLLMLARLRPRSAFRLFRQFAPLVAVHPQENLSKGLTSFVVRIAKTHVRLNRPLLRFSRRRVRTVARLTTFLATAALMSGSFLNRRQERAAQRAALHSQGVVVSRAMGGIGDLIMMTPGLRALAKRYQRPVKFVTNRKFFAVFEHNPDVELIDIDGPPIDLSKNPNWRNLTLCPASSYESKAAPYVYRGRVRLFASGMGVSWRQLQKSGTKPTITLAEADRDFAASFLKGKGFGGRPLIGVQPYSRDSYKNHPEIVGMIGKLAQEFDILVFHHVADGLPQGERIATTAGLKLSQSLALAEKLSALVSVDSAFLHVASAFDVPVVALFGPTDGKIVADHHNKKVVVTAPPSFACMPCWRNEDMPCTLTGQTGLSPCMAAIPYARVRSALDEALGMRRSAAKV